MSKPPRWYIPSLRITIDDEQKANCYRGLGHELYVIDESDDRPVHILSHLVDEVIALYALYWLWQNITVTSNTCSAKCAPSSTLLAATSQV